MTYLLLTPHATGTSKQSPPVDGADLLDGLIGEVGHAQGDVQEGSLVLFAVETVEAKRVLCDRCRLHFMSEHAGARNEPTSPSYLVSTLH